MKVTAVSEHRRKTIFDESHIPDDYSPIDDPEDDHGKGHYGYIALCMAYGEAIRVANKASEYKKQADGGESENEGPPPEQLTRKTIHQRVRARPIPRKP